VRLPLAVDRWLRWVVVTPDMHRVHHSVEDDETNSNFGFNLPWWDRLFGTYRDQPRDGQEGMTIGIRGWRNPEQVDRLPGMLALPFLGPVTDYAINRRQWGRPEGSMSKGPACHGLADVHVLQGGKTAWLGHGRRVEDANPKSE
jgi:hypothetical protein